MMVCAGVCTWPAHLCSSLSICVVIKSEIFLELSALYLFYPSCSPWLHSCLAFGEC